MCGAARYFIVGKGPRHHSAWSSAERNMSVYDKPVRALSWRTILIVSPVWIAAVLLAAPCVVIRVAWRFATDFIREDLEL